MEMERMAAIIEQEQVIIRHRRQQLVHDFNEGRDENGKPINRSHIIAEMLDLQEACVHPDDRIASMTSNPDLFKCTDCGLPIEP